MNVIVRDVLVIAGLLAALWLAMVVATRILRRPRRIGNSYVGELHDDTGISGDGSVLSIQSAEVDMDASELDAIWSPEHLERLARTYWRFLSRCTLGVIRVVYDEDHRFVVLVAKPLTLLTFHQPEYLMDAERGVVRWRIERGLLVASRGTDADGYLEIDVERSGSPRPGRADLSVEVTVANYYPRIAAAFTRWVYAATQSRIHVLVTYGFLKSLARLDLAPSRVGRFASIGEVPDPEGPGPGERRQGRTPATPQP